MSIVLRAIVFLCIFCFYSALVYYKGIGNVSAPELALFFGFNVYFFLPIKVASRESGEDNFLKSMSNADSVQQTDRLLMVAGFIVLIVLSVPFAKFLSTNILGLLLAITTFIISIFLIKKLLILWYEVTRAPLHAFLNGTALDKISIIVSFLGMTTFTVASAISDNPTTGNIMGLSILIMILLSPLLPLILMSAMNSTKISFLEVHLPEAQEIGIGILAVLYISSLAIQIPAVSFALTITPGLLQLFAIIASTPAMFALSTILLSIAIEERKINYLATTGILVIFYSVIYFNSSL